MSTTTDVAGHESTLRWEARVTPDHGDPFTVEVDDCSCGEQVVGGDYVFRRHQFSTIDPLLVREGIHQTSAMLARKMPGHHGLVKHWRDMHRAWRKQAYADF